MLTPVFHNPALPAPEMTILNAALNLLLRTSPQQMTMTQVYKAAGVSKATCYQYFSCKSDLWCALLIEDERLHQKALTQLPTPAGMEDWQRFFMHVLEYPNKMAVFLTLAERLQEQSPKLRRFQQWQALREQNRQLLMAALPTAGVNGDVNGDLYLRLGLIWCTLEGWLVRYRDSDFLQLTGERRQFARQLAVHCARLATQSGDATALGPDTLSIRGGEAE